VNLPRKSWFANLCLLTGLVAVPARAVNPPPAALRELAAHATQRDLWPRLRSYARTQTDQEWSGWALFLAGYQEYQAKVYPQAAQDLAEAAQSGFSLADYAEFYQATALRQSSRAADAAAALQDFSTRFPQSHLLVEALTLRSSALVSSEQFQAAIDALKAVPETSKQAALELLLGQAYMQAQQQGDAATAFQNVYYNFPLSAQAKTAGDTLNLLRTQLGASFPEPSDELKMARAEAIFKAGHFDDALKEYGALLTAGPSNSLAQRWLLEQTRCLVRLHHTADASQALLTHYDTPELESQRLTLMVQLHVQQSDAAAIAQDLAQFEASYASSPAYADALSSAGGFYFRQFNWQEAAQTYRKLWDQFPQNDHLRDDGWRLGWSDYLVGDAKTAAVLHTYLMQYPDSSRAPAALYWLGRVEEDQGVIAEARALYALLVNRFAHTYYAPHAAAHLATLRTRPASVTGPNDSAAAPLAASLIPALSPPVIPTGLACSHVVPSDAAKTALILQSLNLPTLEQQFLRDSLDGENPPGDLRVLLAGTYEAQGNAASAMFAAFKIAPTYTQMEFSDLPEEVWGFLFPQTYLKLIQTQAQLNNLDPYLVMGLIREESAYSPKALSVANARGLMQVLPQTAAETMHTSRTRIVGQRLYDPNYNVHVGCAYLAILLKEFNGQPELAMAAYNAGDFRVKDWNKKYTFRDQEVFLESIPISATRIYVEQVLRDAEIYRQLLSDAPHFAQCAQVQAAGVVQLQGVEHCDGDRALRLDESTPGE